MANVRDALARTIQAEAGNQGVAGMIDVGSVIANRAATGGYGDGLLGVMMKPGQFSAWNSQTGYAGGEQGQNMGFTPNSTAYSVADKILSGDYTDRTGGATHYYAVIPGVSGQPKWHNDSFRQIDGDHYFGNADAGRGGDGRAYMQAQPQGQFSTQGAAPMARAQSPAGLLPMPQAPEQAGILGGILGDKVNSYLTPDRLARLQIGLEGMTLNPNVAMMAAARDGIQGREQDRRAQSKEGERVGQVNKTIEWLNSQGMGDLANAVASGVLPIGQAFNAAQQASQGPARDLKVINGQVVDMNTMQTVGDFRTPDDNSTSLIKNIEYFTALGYSPEEAAQMAKSGQNINVNTGDQGPQLLGTKGDYLIQDENGQYVVRQAPGSESARRESEAAQKAADAAAVGDKADRNEQVRATVVSTGVDTLLDMIDKDDGILDLPETGIVGGALAGLGVNQEAVDFQNTLASLQANVAFDALQKMREASKTGGALGAVSERELTLLISTLGALEQSSSPELMRQNLLTIKDIMGKIERDPVASAAYNGGKSPAGGGDGFSVTGTID